jgi:hypothetical protein
MKREANFCASFVKLLLRTGTLRGVLLLQFAIHCFVDKPTDKSLIHSLHLALRFVINYDFFIIFGSDGGMMFSLYLGVNLCLRRKGASSNIGADILDTLSLFCMCSPFFGFLNSNRLRVELSFKIIELMSKWTVEMSVLSAFADVIILSFSSFCFTFMFLSDSIQLLSSNWKFRRRLRDEFDF